MNFLAHVYLSGTNTPLAIGNLIADRVKGKSVHLLSPQIQTGVYLHRAIDEYTDQHPIFRKCVSKLFPTYRHYSRVIIDMYFDHFLAANWDHFHDLPLEEFSNNFYKKLELEAPNFSQPIQKLIHALICYNWFIHYKSVSGLRKILEHMEQRTSFPSNLAASIEDLNQNYSYFENHFFQFMQELITFTKTKNS